MSDGPNESKSEPPRPPEYRLGPFVFVPKITSGPGDPWAHRKGEPRIFALLWSIYLMGAALLTIFAVRALGFPSMAHYRFGARGMLLACAIGATVLWPLVRLSQSAPRRVSQAILVDILVVTLPIQALIWPMPMLTKWEWSVPLCAILMLTSWSLLVGGVLRHALTDAARGSRVVAMVTCIVLVGAAPVLFVVLPAPFEQAREVLLRLSPLTSVFAMTESTLVHPASADALDWILASAPLIPAIAMWVMPGRVAAADAPETRF